MALGNRVLGLSPREARSLSTEANWGGNAQLSQLSWNARQECKIRKHSKSLNKGIANNNKKNRVRMGQTAKLTQSWRGACVLRKTYVPTA